MSIEIAQHKLAEYREKVDAHIAHYVQRDSARTVQQYGELGEELTSPYNALLKNGGKRMRGALTIHAYTMFGGTDEQLALQAARIVEMVHAYLLIIDDVADRSALRRGKPSAHRTIADEHEEQKFHGNGEHYGESQAINCALAGLHRALVDLGTLPIDDTRKLEAMNSLNEAIGTTVQGQVFDLYYQARQDASESAVRDTLTLKTAYYSFLQPLELGAILAGADTSEHPWLSGFAQHLGLSFQITDDILGTFGTEFDSGKSALDDLREGKMTLLVARALRQASPSQKQEFLGLLGNSQITTGQLEQAKQLFEETGALAYVRQVADREMRQAIEALDQAPRELYSSTLFLRGLAQLVRDRNK